MFVINNQLFCFDFQRHFRWSLEWNERVMVHLGGGGNGAVRFDRRFLHIILVGNIFVYNAWATSSGNNNQRAFGGQEDVKNERDYV